METSLTSKILGAMATADSLITFEFLYNVHVPQRLVRMVSFARVFFLSLPSAALPAVIAEYSLVLCWHLLYHV